MVQQQLITSLDTWDILAWESISDIAVVIAVVESGHAVYSSVSGRVFSHGNAVEISVWCVGFDA